MIWDVLPIGIFNYNPWWSKPMGGEELKRQDPIEIAIITQLSTKRILGTPAEIYREHQEAALPCGSKSKPKVMEGRPRISDMARCRRKAVSNAWIRSSWSLHSPG